MKLLNNLKQVFLQKHFSTLEMGLFMLIIINIFLQDVVTASICGVLFFFTMYVLDKNPKLSEVKKQ